jgi:hypothetical protein
MLDANVVAVSPSSDWRYCNGPDRTSLAMEVQALAGGRTARSNDLRQNLYSRCGKFHDEAGRQKSDKLKGRSVL